MKACMELDNSKTFTALQIACQDDEISKFCKSDY